MTIVLSDSWSAWRGIEGSNPLGEKMIRAPAFVNLLSDSMR